MDRDRKVSWWRYGEWIDDSNNVFLVFVRCAVGRILKAKVWETSHCFGIARRVRGIFLGVWGRSLKPTLTVKKTYI